jgi:alkanesulfonate monooxygenase SsuD/methylene tetrahydromethanopterin reductase-like flavin-dependent oxidoreductase (luciferase family)
MKIGIITYAVDLAALAKQVATPDNFSGGRFIFGIGAGWLTSIEVVAAPVAADREVVGAYEDIGADAAIVFVMPATEREMSEELEQIAQKIFP